MRLRLALKRILITLLKIWTGYLVSTGLPGSKSKPSEARKKKEQKKKGNKRKITASDNRRKRPRVSFRFQGGTPLESDRGGNFVFNLFTSERDEACLRDLLHSNRFFWRSCCMSWFGTFAAIKASSIQKKSLVMSLPIEIVVQLKTY